MKEYVTDQGDTWDLISKKMYGDEKQMIHLMRINPAWTRTVFFPAGVVLEVPDLLEDDVPSELPPWKRGAVDGE